MRDISPHIHRGWLLVLLTLSVLPILHSQSVGDSSSSVYNVVSLPSFELKLHIDLGATVAAHGEFMSRHRRLDAMDNYHTKSSQLDSLSSWKEALQPHSDSASLSAYVRALFVEYTNDYLVQFCRKAFRTEDRLAKGWSSLHAMDLRGQWKDQGFYNTSTFFLEDPQQEQASFFFFVVAFSGTAAILRGTNATRDTNVSVNDPNWLEKQPLLGREEVRLALRKAMDPPDGPYQLLSLILTSSMEDRLYYPNNDASSLSLAEQMERDAAWLLSGAREVQARMDLDVDPNAIFVGSNQHDGNLVVDLGWLSKIHEMNGRETERRESIIVFFQGMYLVAFLGGFYLCASYKYQRNHLKLELERYGGRGANQQEAILFKHKYGRKYSRKRGTSSLDVMRFIKFLPGLRRKNRNSKEDYHSPVTVEIDGVDGFFERELSGIESSEEDIYDAETMEERNSLDYCEENEDLEKGLKESYEESYRKGFDMNPIQAERDGRDYNCDAMNVHDSDLNTNYPSQPAAAQTNHWNNVLETVVPIPASDIFSGNNGKHSTYRISDSNDGSGGVLVQRRYVQPASPFDVLYGAAFLHEEADRVEAQRRLKSQRKKIRASPSGRKRKKKKKTLTMKLVTEAMNGQRSKDTIKPMMTIAEVDDQGATQEAIVEGFNEVFNEEEEEEDDNVCESDDENEAEIVTEGLVHLNPGELRQNPSSISFYSPSNFMRNLSDKYNLGLFDSSSSDNLTSKGGESDKVIFTDRESNPPCNRTIHRNSGDSSQQDFPIEEGVVFRDFPRHDGTPYLMYNAKQKEVIASEITAGKLLDDQVQPLNDEHCIKEEGSVLDINDDQYSPEDPEEDDFKTKMEKILDLKSKQIEERKEMAKQLQARRRDREERKRLITEVENTAVASHARSNDHDNDKTIGTVLV